MNRARPVRLASSACLCLFVGLAVGGARAPLAAGASGGSSGSRAVPSRPPRGAPPIAAGAGGPVAELHVEFAPDAPGVRTTVELSLRVLSATGGPPPPLRDFALRLPAGMGIATTTLGEANCQVSSLLASGVGGCPANALLGYGNATAVIPYASGETLGEHAVLYALMGPPSENRVEVLFYLEAREPVFTQQVMPATLSEDTPPFGEQLRTTVPLVETWPEGPDLALESFSSTLGPLHLLYYRRVGTRSVPYHPAGVRIPSSCPAHGYPFAAVLGFVEGQATTASYSVPCPRRR